MNCGAGGFMSDALLERHRLVAPYVPESSPVASA
jgi:hypothetical protein